MQMKKCLRRIIIDNVEKLLNVMYTYIKLLKCNDIYIYTYKIVSQSDKSIKIEGKV